MKEETHEVRDEQQGVFVPTSGQDRANKLWEKNQELTGTSYTWPASAHLNRRSSRFQLWRT
jgi:hypothetical protein